MEEKGKEELIRLCEDGSIVHMIPTGENCRIEVSAWSAVICEIMLLGIRDGDADASTCTGAAESRVNSPEGNGHMLLSDCCFAELFSLELLPEGYRLRLYNLNLDMEQEIVFKNISMRCEPCNALCERIEDYTRLQTPWEYLGLVARGICCHIEYGVANEAELELRELAEHLEVLQGNWEMVKTAPIGQEPAEGQESRVQQGTDEKLLANQSSVKMQQANQNPMKTQQENEPSVQETLCGFPYLFWKCAAECGVSSVVEKYASDYSKLFRELSKAKYEPFWRKLYQLLAASQEGIPSHVERTCDAGDLQAYRALVTHQVREQGFEGKYPSFYSDAAIQGPSLFFSYESTHIAFHKNGAKRFLLCREQDTDGALEMEFFCGIKFTPEKGDDVFSCMFDCDGQSYFSCFSTLRRDADENYGTDSRGSKSRDGYDNTVKEDSSTENSSFGVKCDSKDLSEIPYGNGYSGLHHADKMEIACTAASKSSHLRRLSGEEYSYKHTAAVWNSKGFYITFFLSCLVMFGALLTVGFMAIEAVLVFLFTQSAADVAECFALTPWGLIFAAAGILYAVPMTVCTYLAMRK